ncbi:MFS transporter [Catenulispora subtropica]|uniref:MFS transporter n=2 Tax=Catenulispora subtropica TaxID=450798 RepID=A0ABP5DQ84_9ACTN
MQDGISDNEGTNPESTARVLGTMVVLAGAVAVFATDNYVTASLLPSVLSDVGGERYFAWTATAFLVSSVFAALLISKVLTRFATRGAVLIGLTVFGVGTALCALSPSIWVLLAGRLVQGLGGGLMSGVSLAAMRMVLPERLWGRMLAVISLMWAVGNVAGPALGGVFAELHAWRWGFGVMVAASVVIGLVAVRSLPAGGETGQARDQPADGAAAEPWPAGSLVLVTVGAAAVSLAGIVPKGAATGAMIALGAALIAAFLRHERHATDRILPALTYARGSRLRWYYLGIAGLTIGVTAETFIPLFGQRLAGLTPLSAGFLGAALSMGWSAAQLATSRITGEAAVRRFRVAAPAVVAVGLALTAAGQHAHAGGGAVALWVVTLAVTGAGIGMGFARFAFPVMSSIEDAAEATKAAAGLNVVQVIAGTFGSALGGVLVNVGAPSDQDSARLLYGGLAVLALVGLAAGIRTASRSGSSVVGTAAAEPAAEVAAAESVPAAA